MAQAFTKESWVDRTGPAVGAAELARMDSGIYLASAPVVTTLPTSPVDGQECNYLADATIGVVWHLVYRAALGKWLFTGGPDLVARYSSDVQLVTTNVVYTIPASIVLPIAGDYDIFWHTAGQIDTAAATDIMSAVYVGGVKASHDYDSWERPSIQFDKWCPTAKRRLTGLAAGATVDIRVWDTNVQGGHHIYNADLRVAPVKIG